MTLNTDRLSKATSRREDMTIGVQNKLPRVESGNLFNQTQSPSLNGISETVQPSVSTTSENINLLSPTNIPTINKEIRQTALKLGGTYLENQRNLMMNTAQYALEQLGLNFNYMWQTQGKDVARALTIGSEALERGRQSVQESKFMKGINKVLENALGKEGAEVAKNIYSVTSPSGMVLKGNELLSGLLNKAGISAQSIEKEYQKDLDETLWGQRREEETISQNIKQGDIPGIAGNIGGQLGYMAPSIMATGLGGKAAGLAVLFPSMFQEAYDRYIQIEGITNNEAFIAATIVGLLNSAVEMGFGLEDMVAGKGVSGFLTKLIKKPVLKYLAKMGINIGGEGLEEGLQRVFEDIGAYMLGESSEFETVGEYLKNVLNVDIKEGSIMSALLLGIPSHVSVTREIKREMSLDSILDELDKGITENLEEADKRATDINKVMEDIFNRDSMLYDLAQEEETYEEFLEDAKGYADEELLQSIWNTVKGKPKVETTVYSDIFLNNITKELNDFKKKIESEYIEDKDIDKDIREEELAYKSPEYYEYKWKNTKTERENLIDNTIEELNNLKKRIESEYIENEDIAQDIREEELAYKSPEYYEYKWRNTKTEKEKLIDKFIEELNNLKKDIESEYIENEVGEDTEEELAYKSPEYYKYKRMNAKTDEEKLVDTITRYLNQLKTDIESEYIEDEDIDQDTREEELAYKFPEYYDYITSESEDIEYGEEEGLEEKIIGEEITQTERDMDLITEFINQAEEHFNKKLAQEQNKTLEDIKRQQQELKDFELTEKQTSQINNALSNLALTVDTKTLREAGLKDNVPKIVDGRYVRPKIFDNLKQGTIGEGVKPEATRKETEQQYYKTVEELNEARNQRRALISLINNLNKTLDTKKINDMINEVNDAMGGNLIGKNILLSDLKNGNIVGAAFKARAMVNDWNKVIKKLKARADRQAWKYIYRLHSESVDNQLIGFSTFSLKHKLKTRPTETKYVNMIQGALKKMSEVFNLDMSKVFEGCHVIFLDYGGSSSRQAWGTMEGFIDGSGTPVIPISLNYVGWRESTVIHELMHGLDFIYQYRNGGVSFIQNNGLMYGADFLYTLNQELPGLYKKLLNDMTYGSGKKGYWTKPTEVMSRIFQEYYEYYVLNQTNTVNDTWHWEDITVVKDAVNKLTDLFREEFGRNPVINGTETIEEYNRKIDDMVNKFNSENTWKFLEMIEKVGLDKKDVEAKLLELGNKLKGGEIDWDKYIEEAGKIEQQQLEKINEKIGIRKEKIKKAGEQMKGLRERTEEAQSVDEVIRYSIMMSDLEFQWDMLMELGQDFTDVMLGTRGELSDLTQETIDYSLKTLEAKEYVEEFDLVNRVKEYNEKYNKRKEELLDKLSELYNNSLVGKGKTKKWFKKKIEKVLYVLARTSDRLLDISPRIGASLMEMEVKSGIMTAKYGIIARHFFKKLHKLTKAQQEEFHKLVIDFGDITADTTLGREKLLAFVDKYGLREEFDVVADMLKAIRDEAIGAGLKVEDRENYFPRNVKDYDGLMEYLNKMMIAGKGDVDYTEETKLLGQLQKAIGDTSLTEEQKQRRIRNVLTDLSGKFNKKVSTRSSHQKKRTITGTKDWGEGLLKFYDTPDVALAKYIEDMSGRIERAKFFGMGVEAEGINDIYTEVENLGLKLNDNLREDIRLYVLGEKDAIVNLVRDVVEQGKDYDSAVDIVSQMLEKINNIYERDTDTSITGVLNKGIKEGWITPDNLEEVRGLLKSYFDSRATSEGAAAIQALSSLVFLSDIRNTLTQTADIGFTIAQGGLIKPVADVILRNNGINVDILGIEDPREELKVDNSIGKVTSKTLKATGFKSFDMFFKNTFLDQVFRSMCKQARSRFKRKQKVLETRLNALWGKEKAEKMLKIYKEGKLPLTEKGALKLEEAMLVLIDCACELGNTQPIYKSSRTQYYNDADMGRNWYNLKSYTLSLLNRWFWSTKRNFRYMREAGYGVTKAGKYAASFLISNMIIMTISEVFAGEIKNLWDTIPYWLYQLTGKGSDDDKEWKETILYTWLNKGSKETGELIRDNFKEQLAGMFLFNRYSKTAWNIYGGKGVIMEQLPPILETITELVKVIGWTYNRIVGENVFADVKNPAIWSRRVPGIGSLIYQSWGKEYAKEHKDVEKIKEKKGKKEDKSSNKYNIDF